MSSFPLLPSLSRSPPGLTPPRQTGCLCMGSSHGGVRGVRRRASGVGAVWVAGDLTDVGPKDAPLRSLYPDEPGPPKPGAPKLKVAIVGAGLAGLSTAVELLALQPQQGHSVEVYEARGQMGGKVASWQDNDGNHIEMGLHVFFGCYHNLFRLMAKTGALSNLLLKDHTHTFVNGGGDVRELDFRLFLNDTKIGAPFHSLKAFFTTPQLSTKDKLANSVALGTSPIVRALIDPEGGMEDIRNLDGVSFSDCFKSHGGSQASIDRWNRACGIASGVGGGQEGGECGRAVDGRRRRFALLPSDLFRFITRLGSCGRRLTRTPTASQLPTARARAWDLDTRRSRRTSSSCTTHIAGTPSLHAVIASSRCSQRPVPIRANRTWSTTPSGGSTERTPSTSKHFRASDVRAGIVGATRTTTRLLMGNLVCNLILMVPACVCACVRVCVRVPTSAPR